MNISMFEELSQGRKDCYGIQLPSGQGSCMKQPLTHDVLLKHIEGRKRVGIYPLDNAKCKFAAVDLDQDSFESASKIARRLTGYGLTAYVERSKGKGYHVWLFFKDWELAGSVRKVVKDILGESAEKVEIFPKQDSASDGFGNFIYLPFFNLNHHGGRTVFVNERGDPFPDQLDFLTQIHRISPDTLYGLSQKFTDTQPHTTSLPISATLAHIDDPFSAILSRMRIFGRVTLEGERNTPGAQRADLFCQRILALTKGKGMAC